MVTFDRSEDGVWTMTLDESDARDRNAIYDATIPQYLTAFDPAFARALEADETEFIKALLRIVGVQDAGWDPYDTTVRAIPAMMKLHALIPPGDEWSETSRHLALWTYLHALEASEPYAMLADLLDIAGGGWALGLRFPDLPYGSRRADGTRATRPQRRDEKMTELRRLAAVANLEGAMTPVDEVWDRELRNAVFHADYSIHGGETRIPALGRRYSHDEIQTLVNRGLAYHESLALLRRLYRGSYTEPATIPIRWRRHVEGGADDAFDVEDDTARIIVRDGVGVIGLKHAHTTAELAQGAIPWHFAHLYPDEAAALRADPTVDHFPARAV
jgi:hypothetical protein